MAKQCEVCGTVYLVDAGADECCREEVFPDIPPRPVHRYMQRTYESALEVFGMVCGILAFVYGVMAVHDEKAAYNRGYRKAEDDCHWDSGGPW